MIECVKFQIVIKQKNKRQPEKIPSWVERILLPNLNEVKGEIKELRVEIRRLDKDRKKIEIMLRNVCWKAK